MTEAVDAARRLRELVVTTMKDWPRTIKPQDLLKRLDAFAQQVNALMRAGVEPTELLFDSKTKTLVPAAGAGTPQVKIIRVSSGEALWPCLWSVLRRDEDDAWSVLVAKFEREEDAIEYARLLSMRSCSSVREQPSNDLLIGYIDSMRRSVEQLLERAGEPSPKRALTDYPEHTADGSLPSTVKAETQPTKRAGASVPASPPQLLERVNLDYVKRTPPSSLWVRDRDVVLLEEANQTLQQTVNAQAAALAGVPSPQPGKE